MKCGCKDRTRVRYRWTLTVQQPTGTPDEAGHVDLTDDDNWTTVGSIKANFTTRGGREGRVFDQVQGEVDEIVKTPSTSFSRSIHPSYRVLFGDRRFNITAAYDIDEMREEVQIELTEVV